MMAKNSSSDPASLLNRFDNEVRTLTLYEKLACGAFSGIFSRFVIAPLDVVKIQLQLQGKQTISYNQNATKYGVWSTFRKIYFSEGFKGFYKGNISALVLYATYSSTQFYSFSVAEELFRNLHIKNEVRSMISGSIAGITATTITYPFDLLRTRFAAQSLNNKKEGIRGFYKGMNSACIQTAPYIGLSFAAYDVSSNIINKIRITKKIDERIRKYNITSLLAGAISGVVSKTIVYPLDLLRKKMQVQGPDLHKFADGLVFKQPGGIISVSKHILVSEGLPGFYRGLWPALVKAGPSSASAFFAYGIAQSAIFNFSKKQS
ncbi:hypothetical protein BB558_005195 [Smittium angustum]|uniref:Mitochondrial thiamine pyrophosphate carrier 1 n=1 Tax=Smittium angustum TaxID=133377 RepID=A0A2U1J173_SMIAN|nr:hypothetical protein BB558_005195 [Smittium angustum]